MFGDRVSLDRAILKPFSSPTVEGVEDYVARLNEAQKVLIELSDKHQQSVLDKRLDKSPANPTLFAEGSYVLVSHKVRPPSKLSPKWFGPMAVVRQIGTNSYAVQDLNTLAIKEFHASRLKLYNADRTPDPLQVAVQDTEEYIVEIILDHKTPPNVRKRDKFKFQFLVKWLGFDDSFNSWEPYAIFATFKLSWITLTSTQSYTCRKGVS
jgi:hypothetical protein